jgi:aspartokinase-like uncharacterized kinase
MTEAPVIVKVGGSLLDWPDLGSRLAAWLSALGRREVVLISGGGTAANFVRDADRVHRLGEEACHWLALRSLTLTAHALAAILPRSVVVDQPAACGAPWRAGRTPVLDPFPFASEDEGRPGALPHSWEVTSDSLAARVAEVMEARELVLLKSVTIPPQTDWAEASRRGLVDGYFPTIIARGVKARAVNLREWRP